MHDFCSKNPENEEERSNGEFKMKKKEATNETQPPILTKPRRLKLHRFCIVAVVKASSFLHRRSDDSDQTQAPI